MRTVRLATIILLAAGSMTIGCSAESGEVTSGDGAAFTSQDAACTKAEASDGESRTEARARCLTAYARKLLDQQIARAEDPRDVTLSSYAIRVPAETGCFTEDVGGNVWQNDIDSERDVGEIAVQIKGVVEFLKYFQRDLDGYPNHFFDAVEICPNGQIGGDLALTGSRLRVGVRTGFFGRIGVHTSTELRSRWTDGEHLVGNDALAALKGARWAMLDPVGTPRTTIRKVVRNTITKLKERLDGLAKEPEPALRSGLSRLVSDEISSAATDASESSPSVRDRALAKMASLSASELEQLRQRWRRELDAEGGGTAEGAEEGAVAMRDVLNGKNVAVKVTQRGFVNVQNYKQIAVSTEAFLPGASGFSRYVEVGETATNVNVEQWGFVNVQLNDVIDVRVQIVYAKTAQTATLDRALGTI